MEKFRFYISSTIVTTEVEVFPIFKAEGSHKLEQGKSYYTFELSDDLHFTKAADITTIKLHSAPASRCVDIKIRIESLSKEVYVVIYNGVFQYSDCQINDSVCWIKVKVENDTPYKCFNDALDTEINTFYGAPVVTSEKMQGDALGQSCLITGLTWNWNFEGTGSPFINPPDPNECFINDNFGWYVVRNEVVQTGSNLSGGTFVFEYSVQTWVAREFITVSCGGTGSPVFPDGGGWAMIDDRCGTASDDADFSRSLPTAEDEKIEALGAYYYGRSFAEIIKYVVYAMGCDLTVKSDFFNINPLGDAPANIAYTFADAFLKYLTFHHKSDVKIQPAANNFADASTEQVWGIVPKDFFEDLEKMFNVQHKIVDGVLILEHYSFFTSTVTLDATAVVPQIKQYSQTGGTVKKETYNYAEEGATYAFKASPIEYPCGEDEEETRLTIFSADLTFIGDTANADEVSDEGFVLIANDNVSGTLHMTQANQPLSWKVLHENLFRHGRQSESGKLNGADVDFLSHIPYIEQETFPIRTCEGTFDPEGLITTFLGNGQVSEAKQNFLNGIIKLNLKF